MTKLILSFFLVFSLAEPAAAQEISAPVVPEAGIEFMPENTDSFADGLLELLQNTIVHIRPDLQEASQISLNIIASVLMISLLRFFSGSTKSASEIAGTLLIASALLYSTNSMIHLGAETVNELSDYGKLLYPVMTAAMAAQGGITASTALYMGTSIFDTILCSLISKLMIPMVYLFLAFATANSAIGESLLKKMSDLIKNFMSWCLKIILMIFTTYMNITGVVSGTTDAAALKATKVTISTVVPIVGGILSDASESVLVSAGIVKNTAGIYGILAVLAVFLEPFLRIGIHYFILKVTACICGVFGCERITGLIDDFSSAMGLLMAMTGAVCLLLLISTVCFLKGVG